ncbi:unnamed protein product [Caenorhabditis brenneri]
MENLATPTSILPLSDISKQLVIKYLDPVHLISFSLGSNEAQKTVKSLFTTPSRIRIDVGFFRCTLRIRGAPGLKLIMKNEELTFSDPSLTSSMSTNQWIRHFLDIFNCSEGIELYFHDACECFPVSSLQEALENIKINRIEILSESEENSYREEVLDSFLPCKCLQIKSNPYETVHEFQKKVLKYHYDELILRFWFIVDIYTVLSLKVVNCQILKSDLSDTHVNWVLKCWLKGWNPDLKFLLLKLNQNNVTEDFISKIFENIEYELNPEERSFPKPFNYLETFKNGYDILNTNGKRATVQIMQNRFINVHFMVWS